MSTINDKLTLANENVPKTYMAGKSCKDMTDFSYYCYKNTRLDMVDCLNTCCGINFSHMFDTCTNLESVPQLDLSNGTDFFYMFYLCNKLTTIPQFDVSNGDDFREMFMNCSALTTIPPLDTSNGTDFMSMFASCVNLTTIAQIDISNSTNHSNMFLLCKKLQNISFEGTIGASISFSDSSQLTLESLQSIVNALKVKDSTSSTKSTLTLNSASWTVLEASTPPTGYSTWKEYITNYKNWLYA